MRLSEALPFQPLESSEVPFLLRGGLGIAPKLHLPASLALKDLQTKIKVWNIRVFGDNSLRKSRIIDEIASVQADLGTGPSDSLLALERSLQDELGQILNQEELLWKQKSRESWLRDGDRNTSYFHLSTLIQRRYNRVSALKNNFGVWISDPEDLERMVVSFYDDLYSVKAIDLFPISTPYNQFPTLDRGDWVALDANFSNEEIYMAVKGMGRLKALGPDGFQPIFYHKCWEHVGGSVIKEVQLFLESSTLPSSGQRVNKLKSRLFVSLNVEQGTIELLGKKSGMVVMDDLGIYLGIPLLHKPVDKTTFEPLLQCINNRLSGWKGKNLSFADRITLARSVLCSLPVYSMATMSLLVSITERPLRDWIIGAILPSTGDLKVCDVLDGNSGWRWEMFAPSLPAQVVLAIAACAVLGDPHAHDRLA
ncbi:hypothetical protein V2J09_016056 [Rumex salicifolius]